LTLRNPVPITGDFFGAAIAAGSTVAVGAPFDGTAAPKAGALYLFERATGVLLEGKPLVSQSARERELFGAAVAMSPKLIVVGAPGDDAEQVGHVYVFDRQTRGLLRTIDNLKSDGKGDRFGSAVAIVGDDLVLVGAPLADGTLVLDSGAAYLFDSATGNPVGTFPNPPQGAFDRFGSAVAPAPDGFMVGAPGPGRVFVYHTASADVVLASAVTDGLAVRNAVAAAAGKPRCGDGILEGSEQCDDANTVDTDDCRNDCTLRQCCVIDPLAADRCNDFDPCTNDSLDVTSGRCVNVDNGQCCTSDASCAGADDVCRICAGCSLYPWDCCNQGTACLLSSPECQGLDCFDKPACECQGGLTPTDDCDPTEGMTNEFLVGCARINEERDTPSGEGTVGSARAAAKAARRSFKSAMRETRTAYRNERITKSCRKQYLDTIKAARASIPTNNQLRRCVNAKNASAG
jgi:cysteine-rich repeat protein